MDCLVHGVTKSQTRLSDFHFHFSQRNESEKNWVFTVLTTKFQVQGLTPSQLYIRTIFNLECCCRKNFSKTKFRSKRFFLKDSES